MREQMRTAGLTPLEFIPLPKLKMVFCFLKTLIVTHNMLKLIDDRYNNTVIYKLVCNDPVITDCYVGHTFDFKTRYSKHKSACYNKKSRKYNYKVYRFIRVNGGFQNISMVPIAYYNCANFFEAKLKELFHMKDLQATLNTQKPSVFVTTKDYWMAR
jgi:hypothetical protein